MYKIKPQVSRLQGGPGLEGLCRRLPGLADDVAVGYVTGTKYKHGIRHIIMEPAVVFSDHFLLHFT